MIFKGFIKKLWKRKIVDTKVLVNLYDSIPIPNREVFKDSKEKLAWLDQIKKEYSKMLSKKKTILSIELGNKNLYEQMKMYIELLFKLLESDEIDTSFENVSLYNEETKKINYMIKMGKLTLYDNRIQNLSIEVMMHLIALKEILESSIFPKRKNLIKEEMNHLACAFKIYLNQKQTIKLGIENYVRKYENLETEKTKEEIIAGKCTELQKMASVFIPESIDFQRKNTIVDIIGIEESLEKYIYEHKSKVQELREELAKLKEIMETFENPEQMISKIETLEMQLKAYSIYGYKLVNEEDFKQLYQLKFVAITENIMAKEEQYITQKCNFIELECYMEIISSKLSLLITGTNPYLKINFGNSYQFGIKQIKEALKNKTNEFSAWDILNDKKKLGLLLAFEKDDGLENYFRTCMEPKAKYSSVDFHEQLLEFEDILSLDTIYSMKYYNEEDAVVYMGLFEPLYAIYRMLKLKHESDTKFVFPQGLKSVKNSNSISNNDLEFISEIERLCQGKDIEFPSSLREYSNSSLLSKIKVSSMKFQDGIKKISNRAFANITANSIEIPSSVLTIDKGAFRNASIKNIYINNYRELKLDFESVENLVDSFFYIKKVGESNSTFSFEGARGITLGPAKCVILPKFQSISFLEDRAVTMTIDRTEIKITSFKHEGFECGIEKLNRQEAEIIGSFTS